jgi:hypothetical protein
MVTVSGTTHIRTAFSFTPDIGKHFTGNAMSSLDDSVMHLVRILHIFTTGSVLCKSLQENITQESNLENEGAREWVPRPIFFRL